MLEKCGHISCERVASSLADVFSQNERHQPHFVTKAALLKQQLEEAQQESKKISLVVQRVQDVANLKEIVRKARQTSEQAYEPRQESSKQLHVHIEELNLKDSRLPIPVSKQQSSIIDQTRALRNKVLRQMSKKAAILRATDPARLEDPTVNLETSSDDSFC